MEEILEPSILRTLAIGAEGKARVWFGELPHAKYAYTRKVTQKLTVGQATNERPSRAAAEVLVHVGPRMLYGLLGGRWEAKPGKHLIAELYESSPRERLFPGSLATGTDEVRVGLPEEYLNGVLRGLDLAKDELSTLRAGKLQIDCAAHGSVGSSHNVFKHLAVVLIKLLSVAHADWSDQELARLFPSTFW